VSAVGVNELFRFRTVRAITQIAASATAYVVPDQATPAPPPQLLSTANSAYSWLLPLSATLAAQSDYLTPQQVTALLPQDWQQNMQLQAAAAGWTQLRTDLHSLLLFLYSQIRTVQGAFGLPIVPVATAAEIEETSRILLIYDLIATLVANPNALQSAQDVQTALTFRNVILPTRVFGNPAPPVLARQPGVTDLSIVNDEWNRYIPGELENVVNVLPGETFDEKTFHLDETDTTTSSSEQQTTTQTTTNSQTTSQTLSQTATSTATTSIGANAQVEVSGGFGPMQIKTNIGAQIQTSKSSSQTLARTTAMQTVASAVKTVSETITQSQTTRTKTKDTDFQEHKQQNQTAAPIVGLYRWLSVVHRCEVVNYPNRLVLEFEIPEPGAWLLWALANQPDDTPWSNPDPGPFTTDGNALAANGSNAILPSSLTTANVGTLAYRWRVQGISQPPPASVTLSQSYMVGTTNPGQVSDNSMGVPDGYQADTWTATYEIEGGDDSHQTDFWIAVGRNGQDTNLGNPGNVRAQTLAGNIPAQQVGSVNTGTVPVSMFGFYTGGGTFNVTITCSQQDKDQNGNGTPTQQWQQSTFDQIVGAYNTLLSGYNQERVARAQQQTGPIVVGPPDLNLARSVMELKKAVISDLLGNALAPNELWTYPNPLPTPYYGPGYNPQATVASSPVIQFFEQAFEWENIVYICYPYFWGGQQNWLQNATYASQNPSDPVFDQFLNAGSARVVVPARPGFEKLVNYYLYTQQVWGGQNPPGPNDPGYLSIADEIEAIQVGATDGTPVPPSWEITLPTTFLWAGTDPSTLPVNPAPTIPAPP
jgi:hypothetical protein